MKDSEEVYPLENDVYKKLTLGQKIQIAIMTITIVPLRILFGLIILSVLWPLGIIVTIGKSEKMKKEPLKGWRRSLYWLVRFVSRSLYFVAGFHWFSVYGEPNKDIKIITAAPHSSYLDSLFIVYMNFISIIARAGSDEVFLFGNLTKMCHPIIVNREKAQSRSDTVSSLFERLNSNLDWPKIAIFPEGTCTNRKALVKFKTGAFIPGLPVQPVCIRFPNKNFDSISWTWEGPGAFEICWLTLCQIHSPVEFHFLPVYHPSNEEKKDPVLYAENVRKIMADYLNIPLSDYSYEDGILVKNLAKYNLPKSVGLIKIQKLRKKLHINEMDEILNLIPYYANLAKKTDGLCYFTNFAESLNLKNCNHVQEIFDMFDRRKCGFFNFKDFIEVYFEQIDLFFKNKSKQDLIEKIIQSLDKFNNNFIINEKSYELNELNKELKTKYDFEFLSLSQFNVENDGLLTEGTMRIFLKQNPLYIYIILESKNYFNRSKSNMKF